MFEASINTVQLPRTFEQPHNRRFNPLSDQFIIAPLMRDDSATEGLLKDSVSTLSPLESEKLMPKDKTKGYSYCHRLFQTMKNSTRYIVLGILLAAVLYLSINYFNVQSVVTLSPDRSEAYNVKILPASLSDEDLNKLAKDTFSYLAMIDAGSSGCRAHVYRYGKLGTITGPLYVLPQHDSKKVKPGLSTFATHPQDAGASLQGLIDFMKEQVPEKDWAVTPIWLKATAGLRMLEPSKSEAVLESVRAFLGDKTKSPFLFRPSWARIIPGNEEGGFGWIAYNYLKRIIGPKKDPSSLVTPYAVVEMGGASAQVSQMAPTPAAAAAIPAKYKFTFNIEKDIYHLYTHSYLGFGAEQGREQLNKALAENSGANPPVKDPCLYPGYTRGASDLVIDPYQGPAGLAVIGNSDAGHGACVSSLSKIFKMFRHNLAAATKPAPTGATPEPVCDLHSHPAPHSFGCVHQPDFVSESNNFLVFENFYYMASGINVQPVGAANTSAQAVFPLRTTAAHIQDATTKVCSANWDTVQATYPLDSQPKDVGLKMCFSGSYAYSFLVDGLKIAKDKVLTIQKEVGASEIEWALGAAYKEAADLLKRTNLRPT